MNRLVLTKPSFEYKNAITEMLDEWVEYNNTHDTNHSPSAIFHDYSDFDAYLDVFVQNETNPKEGYVPSTTYFALDKERNVIVGAVSIRHYLNEVLRNSGGHIGDGVRPSERRKGYATEMLGLALEKCKEMGIDKVMISCDDYNDASRKTIINNGGVFERTAIDKDGTIEIYWIDLTL